MDKVVFSGLEKQGFTMQKQIGEGGYARVYTVTWSQYPDEIFVAKVIPIPNKLLESNEKTYMNEINTLSKLFHKNIVKIYKHFMIYDYMVIIMEYCQNGTLDDYIKKNGPLNEDQFKSVAQECLNAVAFCHENSIAHRDIKPSNFIIDRNLHIKLCDFGISDIFNGNYTTRTDGSLMFSPPELVMGKAHDAMLGDIWELGITYYYCITGQFPWFATNKPDMKSEILFSQISFPPSVPKSIQYIINAMTKKVPTERLTAEQLLKSAYFIPVSKLQIVIPRAKKIDKSLHKKQSTPSPIIFALQSSSRCYTCKIPLGKTYNRHLSFCAEDLPVE